MPAFAAAIDVLFADADIAAAAIYTPVTGDGPKSVRVITRRPDEIIGLGDTRVHTESALFDVRVSEVPTPAAGDTLEVDGDIFVVQGEPVRDRDWLIWTLDTRPA